MTGENFEHWVLTQCLSDLEEPPAQSWRRDEIIAWLQEGELPLQRELSRQNYYILQQLTSPQEGGEAVLLIFFSLLDRQLQV
jgi:hypothetical protein